MHDTGKQPRYETRDVAARPLVWSAIGLVLLTVAGLGASWMVMKYFVTTQKLGPPASPFDQTRTIPPAPRLSVKPELDLKRLQTEEQNRLGRYGWVDRATGAVHVPIERAMELSIERGFPVRSSPGPSPQTGAQPGKNSPGPQRQSP